jgi:hypothetical protein
LFYNYNCNEGAYSAPSRGVIYHSSGRPPQFLLRLPFKSLEDP